MKHYIEIEGKKYRVLVCWNAVAMYLQEKGIEDLSDFGNIAEMKASDMLIMFFWALYYGEDSEGRQLPYPSSHKLGNVVTPVHVAQFTQMFAEQMKAQIPKSEEPISEDDVKKKKSFFRR